MPSRRNPPVEGAMGARYGMPNACMPLADTSMQKNMPAMPSGPSSPPARMNRRRSTVMGSYSEGTTKVQMAVRAATMTTGVPTSPAETAASPTISAATRLTEWPMGLGRRRPASRTISRRNVTSIASKKSGSGVACSLAAILYSISLGKSSGVKFAMLTNTP